MELRQLKYKNVHGHLSGNLSFEQGENFIVGINGCGKTTALNLVKWMLGPSLPDLCTLEHDSAELKVKHGKYLYTISSKIKKHKHVLTITTKDPQRGFKPITTPLHVNPRAARKSLLSKDVRDAYFHMSPEPHEVEAWSFLLEDLPSPVFVGLKRDIEEETLMRHPGGNILAPPSGQPALGKATELMRDAFNTARRQIVAIHDELNEKVLELSFRGVLSKRLPSMKGSVESMREKIVELKGFFDEPSTQAHISKALSSETVRDSVLKYLGELEKILSTKSKDSTVLIALNQHNFSRAEKMFELFVQHEDLCRTAQAEIDNFSQAVNSFLGDSNKKIVFDDDTGTPEFAWTTRSDGVMSLSELSSGEAQVVILLSYFAFLAKTGVPIIIDEPELSLHVKWQAEFVKAVKTLLPAKCQTVMATHSPEICGADSVNVQAVSIGVK